MGKRKSEEERRKTTVREMQLELGGEKEVCRVTSRREMDGGRRKQAGKGRKGLGMKEGRHPVSPEQ